MSLKGAPQVGDGLVGAADIAGVVLVMVVFEGLGRDVRLQGVLGEGKIRELVFHGTAPCWTGVRDPRALAGFEAPTDYTAVAGSPAGKAAWAGAELEETCKLIGDNYWPYGIEPNRKTLETLFRYLLEQGLASRELTIEELGTLLPELENRFGKFLNQEETQAAMGRLRNLIFDWADPEAE